MGTSWVENGWLQPHSTSRKEITNLLGIVDRPGAEGKRQVWRSVVAGRSGLVLSGEAAKDESVWKEARFAASGGILSRSGRKPFSAVIGTAYGSPPANQMLGLYPG